MLSIARANIQKNWKTLKTPLFSRANITYEDHVTHPKHCTLRVRQRQVVTFFVTFKAALLKKSGKTGRQKTFNYERECCAFPKARLPSKLSPINKISISVT
ncbi:hypothetical protein [Marinobacter similis]|uniref:hypothetical protein n=1 Tax=Marinobacter similis TaxID=1420916 RepID=UPI0011DDFBBC|nr:hypothetical protein [Marinobacter similis]